MNGKTPHLVQYQGSKRLLAPQILEYLPPRFHRLVEPFAGMAAVSIAAAERGRAERFYINDLNAPLVSVLREAVETPEELIRDYTKIWEEQFSYGEDHTRHFYDVRDRFNQGEQSAANMLYLLARCVKGAVRYGKSGNFNQSPDRRRHGTRPSVLAGNVRAISRLLKGRAVFSALDYRGALSGVQPGDVVYLDPPYQGVGQGRDGRYFGGVSFEAFAESIGELNRRGIPFLISYDGFCGEKRYGRDLPDSLRCQKVWLNGGRSAQFTLLGMERTTWEALYVSEGLLFPAAGKTLLTEVTA